MLVHTTTHKSKFSSPLVSLFVLLIMVVGTACSKRLGEQHEAAEPPLKNNVMEIEDDHHEHHESHRDLQTLEAWVGMLNNVRKNALTYVPIQVFGNRWFWLDQQPGTNDIVLNHKITYSDQAFWERVPESPDLLRNEGTGRCMEMEDEGYCESCLFCG